MEKTFSPLKRPFFLVAILLTISIYTITISLFDISLTIITILITLLITISTFITYSSLLSTRKHQHYIEQKLYDETSNLKDDVRKIIVPGKEKSAINISTLIERTRKSIYTINHINSLKSPTGFCNVHMAYCQR